MLAVETKTRKITSRLEQEGWIIEHGKEHDIYRNRAYPGVRIVVPRHRELSIGVARSIAKLAKW